MNRRPLLCSTILLVLVTGLIGAKSSLQLESSDRLFEGKSIRVTIAPSSSKYYLVSGDRLREGAEFGMGFLLDIHDPGNLDVDLFIHDGIPGENNRIKRICSSQERGATETCRVFFSDITSKENAVVIELRGLAEHRRTRVTLTSEIFAGPRLGDTRQVADDAKVPTYPLDIEGAKTSEPILQLRTELDERRPFAVYAIELPDTLSGPLVVDLLGTLPRGKTKIRIFDDIGNRIAESFDPAVNSSAEIPFEQKGRVVFVQIDSSEGNAFLFERYVDVVLNFRLPTSVPVVHMEPNLPLRFRSNTNKSFLFKFKPRQMAMMKLHGCADQPFLESDLGSRVHVVASSFDKYETLVFFGERYFGEGNATLLYPYSAETTIKLSVSPQDIAELEPTSHYSKKGAYDLKYTTPNLEHRACTLSGTVTDETNYLMAFDPNKSSNLFIEDKYISSQGVVPQDAYLTSFRVSQRQLERSGATGIAAAVESDELDIAIALSNGFVQSIGGSEVQWDWNTTDTFTYIVLFRNSDQSENNREISYSLDLFLTYGTDGPRQSF